jgi:hypothetical protein
VGEKFPGEGRKSRAISWCTKTKQRQGHSEVVMEIRWRGWPSQLEGPWRQEQRGWLKGQSYAAWEQIMIMKQKRGQLRELLRIELRGHHESCAEKVGSYQTR